MTLIMFEELVINPKSSPNTAMAAVPGELALYSPLVAMLTMLESELVHLKISVLLVGRIVAANEPRLPLVTVKELLLLPRIMLVEGLEMTIVMLACRFETLAVTVIMPYLLE